MKSIQLKKLSTLILMALLTVAIGCTENDLTAPSFSDQSTLKSDNGIKILTISDGLSLRKVTQISKFINAKEGGVIELIHRGSVKDNNEYLEINCRLEIPAKAMDKDADISLTIDDKLFSGAMDVEFSPHGTIFSTPALLSIKAKGLDLEGIDPQTIGFYYDNQETGEWEEMEYDELKVDVKQGTISVKNAQLPHFSRYAIGTE